MNNIGDIVIKDILDVITVFSKKGRREKMINRKCYGLSFTSDGEITYVHNGNAYISDPEHAVILPKGQSYSIYGNREGCFPVINFECENFSADTRTVIPVSNALALIKDFNRLDKAFYFGTNKLECFSIFYGMLNIISEGNSVCSKQILPAIKYIEENFCNDITNAVLASRCMMGEEYFRKLFKQNFGISPKQYITDMRINKAKKMLIEGSLKINAISEQCGFSNPFHFCRFFKAKTGETPSEYMKNNMIVKI